jgi:hypothetical protein
MTYLCGASSIGDQLFFRTYRLDFPGGAKLCFDDPLESNSRPILDVPASVLESMKMADQRSFLGLLKAVDFKATRVDVSADDMYREVLPRQVFTEGRIHRNVCRFHAAKARMVIGEEGYKGRSGDTAYFGRRGSKGSGRCLRVYDKSVESEGEIDAIRWEVEFSDEQAHGAFCHLVSSHNDADYVERLASLVGGSVDFREGAGDSHESGRCPRVEWWAEILTRIGNAFRVLYRRHVPTIDSIAKWWEKSVCSSMKCLREAWRIRGNNARHWSDWVRFNIDDAELSRRHLLLLRQLARQAGVDPCL